MPEEVHLLDKQGLVADDVNDNNCVMVTALSLSDEWTYGHKREFSLTRKVHLSFLGIIIQHHSAKEVRICGK